MPSERPTVDVDHAVARVIEELQREISEAHRREAATAEVLKAISRSASELRPAHAT